MTFPNFQPKLVPEFLGKNVDYSLAWIVEFFSPYWSGWIASCDRFSSCLLFVVSCFLSNFSDLFDKTWMISGVSLSSRCPGSDWFYRAPKGNEVGPGSCYYVYKPSGSSQTGPGATSKNYNDSITDCKMRGGKLATFTSAEEVVSDVLRNIFIVDFPISFSRRPFFLVRKFEMTKFEKVSLHSAWNGETKYIFFCPHVECVYKNCFGYISPGWTLPTAQLTVKTRRFSVKVSLWSRVKTSQYISEGCSRTSNRQWRRSSSLQ